MNFDRFAAIADIHGNSDALAAVLDDIDSLGVETIVNLGDHLSGPLAARETMGILLAREMTSIRGNHDRWLFETPDDELGVSDRAAKSQLDDGHVDWLRALPATMTVAGGDVFLCHGTPASDTTYWMETVAQDGSVIFNSQAEIERHAVGLQSSLVLCAHTHIARAVRLKDGRQLVNPGSVGCPGYTDDQPVFHIVQSGNPNASYAILEKHALGWHVTFRSIPYDTSRMARLAREAGRLDWAGVVSSGWIEP